MIAGPLIGSEATAFCAVIVLPQCVRKRNQNATPRAEQRGWAAACFALTVALAAQITGGPARLRSQEFRVTELGGGIALLALVVAAAFAVAHQRAGRYASSRPGARAITLAAGAAVVLAAGMGVIVSRSSSTRPGQAFPWLCLLAASLATAASLVIRERALAAHSRGAYAGDGRSGGGAAPARRAWPESRDAWDDWDRPLSGDRARPAWDEGPGADWDPPISEDAPADSGPPIGEDAPAEAAQADPGPPIDQGHPAKGEPAGGDAAASKEPQASDEDDEDVSDWFRPARKKAPVELDDADVEAAASWEAPSYWFRPAVEPDDDFRDAPPLPDALPEVADEPDPLRSPD
jgi:hypothetical protein